MSTLEMGQDGLGLNTTSLVARDAYGFSLNYFASDYSGIYAGVTPFAGLPSSLPGDINGVATGKQLFNGNIAAMAVNILVLGKRVIYGYTYDQLNRLVRMDAFDGKAIRKALINTEAPGDIITAASRKAMITGLKGILYSKLSDKKKFYNC